MSSQFGFIDIILLAMFAGFIILRLRNILGRKTGHQGRPMSRFFPRGVEVLKDIENNEAIKSGNIDEAVEHHDDAGNRQNGVNPAHFYAKCCRNLIKIQSQADQCVTTDDKYQHTKGNNQQFNEGHNESAHSFRLTVYDEIKAQMDFLTVCVSRT